MKFDHYEIAKYRPELKNEIARLQTHLWGPDVQLNSRYFTWKYGDNPYCDEPLVYVAISSGHVVGMIGLVGTRWEVGTPQRITFALATGDTVIDPAHRDRALFTKMFDVALRDLRGSKFEFVYCMSAIRVTRLSLLMSGWRSVGSLEWGYRLSRMRAGYAGIRQLASRVPVLSTASRFLARPATVVREQASRGSGFDALDRHAAGSRRKYTGRVSISRAPRGEAMAELVERSVGDGRYRLARDAEYYTWRFQNPRSHYRFVYCGEDVLQGYLVLQWSNDEKDKRVRILDWEAPECAVFLDMVKTAIAAGKFPVLTTWSAPLTEAQVKGLETIGFKFTDQEIDSRRHAYASPLLVKPLREKGAHPEETESQRSLFDLANWDLREVFSDHN